MDPTWDDTIEADATRAPASTAAVQTTAPSWDDTQDISESAPSWDDTADLQSQYGTPGQQALAGIEGAGRGVLGPVFTGAERLAGADPNAIRMREEANPWTAGLSEFGSFAGTAALTLGSSAEARAALEAGELAAKEVQGTSAVAKIAKNFTVPGLIERVGQAAQSAIGLGEASGLAKVPAVATKLGTEFAALQGLTEINRAVEQDPDQTVASAAAHIGLSGLLGAGIGVPFGAGSAAWEKLSGPLTQSILEKVKANWGMGDPLTREETIVSPALKQILNVFDGVPKETMEAYAAQRDAVMAAPEFQEVYGHALDHILDMQDNLAAKKVSVAEAKANFDNFLDQQRVSLQQAGRDAATADAISRQAMKEAETRITLGFQNGALEAAPKAFSAVQKLKDNVFDLSAAARAILDDTPGQLSLKPFFEAVRPMQDELYSQGFPHLAEALQKEVDMWGSQYGDKIGYPDAKSMIQGLQKKGKWDFSANEVQKGLSPYFNRLSGIMNESLKDAVTAYRTAMQPTAEASALLQKLGRYGTPEAANRSVLGLKNIANYTNDMPLLKSLEEKSGVRFTEPLENYANPEIRENMVKASPEYAQSLKTSDALQQLKDPETIAAIKKSAYLSQPARALENAQAALQSQLERKEAMAGITTKTLESKMKSVIAGRGIESRRVLEAIPGMNDMTIPEILDLIRIREAFEKGAMNGSRNVNLLASLGGGLGSVIGGIGGTVLGAPGIGAGIGATVGGGLGGLAGGILDKEGPALVKAHLDRYLNKWGDLPKAVGSNPDTIRVALLHFLGADTDVSAKAFKSAANFIESTYRGSNLIKRGAESIFPGAATVPDKAWTDFDKMKKLDDKTKKIQGNEQQVIGFDGDLGKYMPHHAQALAQTVARSVSYINQNRPYAEKLAPLDDEIEPSRDQTLAFERGLELAEQPLSIVKRIKDGTILPEDIQHLNAMYPEYYQHMKSSVMDAMGEHLSQGKKIPYQLRQSLSLFLGETLDSSFSPQNIMAAQNALQGQRAAAQPQMGKTQSGTSKLSEGTERYRTADQSAQSRRSSLS